MINALQNSPFRGPGGIVFLIGFMGSGKTYWGNIWAKKNGLAFYDLDEVIEKEQHKTIAAIFEKLKRLHYGHLQEQKNALLPAGVAPPALIITYNG
jgi:shikimate kinase